MDVQLQAIPTTRALMFSRTFDVGEPDAVDCFGSLARRAMLGAGVEPSGPFGGIMRLPDPQGRMHVTIVIPVERTPDPIPLDASAYLVEEGDALVLDTVRAIATAASTRVEGPCPTARTCTPSR